ncbi:arginine-tRNA-protein transferase 1 [Westerdykella ornata]|uniref:arginyltransferase n=1 Tax=Westerdykella ornata TaxID=318751 RepID=A0A6A6JAN6_WESOR|nr:arginine-tRNA-protein transferase 1 [Westerdykella ornata]KAF2273327.1 arginine-tRNA-protein transferase 1 [Westerdykella ornata]
MQSLVTPCGASYYITSNRLTVDVYQALVDRGWRRSGTIFYKPDVLRHCCPHYTIRLPVAEFKPTRDQRQSVNRWNRHILGEEYIKEAAKLHPKSKQEKARQRNSYDLVSTIHESEYDHVKRPPEPAHKFEVTLEPDEFTQEKYDLFRNYQQHVHHEKPHEISAGGFRRFLCSSPLQRTTRTVEGKIQQLGSFHQCYRVDGRLVAMAVLDLLPHCVSGVYLVYHSDFEKWSFGKISAMREAALALEGGYQYYYMGFYIHSCAKMRYKGQYQPSYILDPETYEWTPLNDDMRKLLDSKPFVSLSRERRRKAGSEGSSDEHAEDRYEDYPHPTAAEGDRAVRTGMSLFDLKVPGLMSAVEIMEEGILDTLLLRLRRVPGPVEAQNLVTWESSPMTDPNSIKGMLAELVACLGPEAAPQIVVDLH